MRALKGNSQNQTLLDLNLSRNCIQPAGLGVVANALKNNYSLQKLHLDHNPLLAMRQNLPPIDASTSKRSLAVAKQLVGAKPVCDSRPAVFW